MTLRTAWPALRLLAAAAACSAFAPPAFAIDFAENDQGQIEFVMPSGNIGCVYTPKGGTDTYQPVGGGPELSCDRVEPAYVRVILGPKGKAVKIAGVGDASCCGSDNVFDYGEVWKMGPFSCSSATSGLACVRGTHGFTMSRRKVTAY